ncbi:MAG: AMP-binding protein, partial [Oscillospiraceae bacterium]|nr:AMP-binding protein [Oscillospiraceae bacterium]
MNTQKQTTAALADVAARIRELREIEGLTPEDAAERTGFRPDIYRLYESGAEDLPFSFIHKCALLFGVDISDLLEGTNTARLSHYAVTRRGRGRVTAREPGIEITELAPMFRDKLAEPYWVTYAYSEEQQTAPIDLDTHGGHEFDVVISGSLKVQVGEHIEVLSEGDSIYYNSGVPHGMIAVGGHDCVFCAVVLPGKASTEALSETVESGFAGFNHINNTGSARAPETGAISPLESKQPMIFENFIETDEDETGTPLAVRFKNIERFNFAFDVVDALAEKYPSKLAMLHIDRDFNERRFTFEDMSRQSSRAANYLASLGVKRGDHVMLVLKRNWQFWTVTLALHKLGAVMIPAPDQLLEKDFDYRFKAGNVSAIIATAQSDAYREAEKAMEYNENVRLRVMAGGAADGWRDFDGEFEKFRGSFPREQDAPGGDDAVLMFFSSGTTGYPKLVTHSHTYGLGHFVTAYYWHRADPNGLHFTISDTG